MRPIDADALKDNAVDVELPFHPFNKRSTERIVFLYDIDDAPTISAEPVRHGRYDESGDCTVCGYPMPTDDRCDAIFPQEIKYCYNCGAKMRGDTDETE